jgi:molecular chaperone GrpE (heat shock protein)
MAQPEEAEQNRQAQPDHSTGAGLDLSAAVEEIAEDTLAVLRRLVTLEQGQAAVMARLDRLGHEVADGVREHEQGLDQLRRNLLTDRKHLGQLWLLDAVAPWLESLQRLRARADRAEPGDLSHHIDSVLDVLNAMIRDLGFEAFTVDVGEAFDPRRMASAGYAEGPSGVVLSLTSPGYQAAKTVVRPARVLICAPETTTETRPRPGEDS